MVLSYDVGSLPLHGGMDIKKFSRLAESYSSLRRNLFPGEYDDFTDIVLEGFVDKLKAGVDVPNYFQPRDMNEMFWRMIYGVEKSSGGYSLTGPLSTTAENARIAEVSAIRENLGRLSEEAGGKIELKVCVTGPYTLAAQLNNRTNSVYAELGEMLSEIVKANVFSEKHGAVRLVAIDEPAFGVDDSNLDSEKVRKSLLKSWNGIAREATRLGGVETILHLHNTSDPLFWESKVNVIESHVGDPIYTTAGTRRLLEERDKFLKAPIAVTQFDDLIRQKIRSDDPEKIAAEWERIRRREADPVSYLEDPDVIKKRLERTVEFFGEERVPYAGPECGLGGHYVGKYPFYDCAIEYLKRIASVVKDYNASAKTR